uniref:Uncharacterized protein n=1 Tax=Chelydra serpentina TaxID=8475 RepID=A0A8C3SSG2_CHESE
MGNMTSCCVSSSHKLLRNAHTWLESYRLDPKLRCKDTGCNSQHISDRENIYGDMETFPPPHPPHTVGAPIASSLPLNVQSLPRYDLFQG